MEWNGTHITDCRIHLATEAYRTNAYSVLIPTLSNWELSLFLLLALSKPR